MKGIWIAFGVGVAAGAVVTLLYAPQSGAQTRKQIRKGVGKGVERAGDYLDDTTEFLREKAEKLSDEAQTLIQRTRRQMEDLVEATSGVVDGAMKTAKAVKTLM